MEARILSTSNFKKRFLLPRRALVFLYSCFVLSCMPNIAWIRELPKEEPLDQNLLLGKYERITEKKSAYGAKGFLLDWKESIHLQTNQSFVKDWLEWRVYDSSRVRIQRNQGIGIWEKSGTWLLLKTQKLRSSHCELNIRSDFTITVGWLEASCPLEGTKNFSHRLLYFVKDESIFPLQYESGYLESDFGIAWESDKPYKRTEMFERALVKYGKKEFQPHVYTHVKLD